MNEIKTIETPQRRGACAADEPWRRQLFAQLRGLQPELLVACPELLEQQWQLQQRVFASEYPDACTELVLLGGRPVGILVWHEGKTIIRLLEIGLEQRYRGRGLGEQVLSELIRHADQQGKVLALAVMRHNPALRLYKRLGFSLQNDSDESVQVQMRREPMRSA
ncbi:GNAT family N-acetyltransferase [Pseudomonas fluvialis]|uniref:GNAT family N-acetyltransferase n=1 Tax=Pseudomonas fluvialis TaxID=1793966 RepID=UPI00370AAE6B